jgi:hypothetical protein
LKPPRKAMEDNNYKEIKCSFESPNTIQEEEKERMICLSNAYADQQGTHTRDIIYTTSTTSTH